MPTIDDILAARKVIEPHLPPTPLWSYPVLNAAVGAEVHVKHENVQPVGAFKVRGGLTLLAGLTAEERRRGLVTWSTGNHAQSIAYASAVYDTACTVVMHAAAAPNKVEAVRALGAEVVLHGANLEDARAWALANAGDRVVVSPGDTPGLIAGVGTLYVEIIEARPDLDAVVVPVGSGTGAAGAVLAAAALAPGCRVYGVQSSASPAGHDSWRAGELVERPNRTRVDGVATGHGYALPQAVLRGGLADFLLVDDDAIADAQRLLATHAHTLAEGAGAAALAGVLSRPDLFAGRRVAVVCTGGNASAAEIARLSPAG
jgi:threonine dehydratase